MNIGIDLGGTHIGAGLVDNDGKIVIQDELPTERQRDSDEIIKDMAALVRSLTTKAGYSMDEIETVGIGCPGVVDLKGDKVVFADNLNWHDVPLRKEMESYLNLPVYIDNDANAAALAENICGAAVGAACSVMLTLGTGVGSGIILDGNIFCGFHGVGAELGHTIIDVDGPLCACGNRGCLEQYASATGLVRIAKEILHNTANSKTLLHSESITAKDVIDAAKSHDQVALEIFNLYIKYLCIGIINIINSFDPEVVVIGGGISKAGNFLLDALKWEVRKNLFCKGVSHASIRLGKLGNDAGIIGAAMLSGHN